MAVPTNTAAKIRYIASLPRILRGIGSLFQLVVAIRLLSRMLYFSQLQRVPIKYRINLAPFNSSSTHNIRSSLDTQY